MIKVKWVEVEIAALKKETDFATISNSHEISQKK